jgi:hypothetical protein
MLQIFVTYVTIKFFKKKGINNDQTEKNEKPKLAAFFLYSAWQTGWE